MKKQEIDQMYANIERHGNNLLKLFPDTTEKDPIKLCKKLHSLENKAHNLTLDECNTGNSHHVELCNILEKVKRLLFRDTFGSDYELYKSVFINGDARGYALKIKDDYIREHNIDLYKDWGGYGIIAPDFTPE